MLLDFSQFAVILGWFPDSKSFSVGAGSSFVSLLLITCVTWMVQYKGPGESSCSGISSFWRSSCSCFTKVVPIIIKFVCLTFSCYALLYLWFSRLSANHNVLSMFNSCEGSPESVDMTIKELEEILKEGVVAEGGSSGNMARAKVVGIACDVCKPDDVRKLANFAVSELGSIDIWVSNLDYHIELYNSGLGFFLAHL